MALRQTITNGPSKFDLMVSLFDGGVRNRRPVLFTYSNKNQIRVVINWLDRDSGDGENWSFCGYETRCDKGGEPVSSNHIRGFYSIKERTGWIDIV